MSGSPATSTPVKSLWLIYSKWRSIVLGVHDAPPCKSIRFGMAGSVGAPESGNLSRSCFTEKSGSVEKCDFTTGGFSNSEAITKTRANDGDGGLYKFSSGDGVVRVPPVESIAEEEEFSRGEDRYYPGQSPKIFLKDFRIKSTNTS